MPAARRLSKQELLEIRKQLGQRIADLRRAQDPPMTQFDLAAASGVRPEAISRIERGAVDFGISNLFKISSAFGLEATTLLQLPGKIAKSRRTSGYADTPLETPQYVHQDTRKRERKK